MFIVDKGLIDGLAKTLALLRSLDTYEITDLEVKNLLATFRKCENEAEQGRYDKEEKLLLAFIGSWIWQFHQYEHEIYLGESPEADRLRKEMKGIIQRIDDLYSKVVSSIEESTLNKLVDDLNAIWLSKEYLEPKISVFDTAEHELLRENFYIFSQHEESMIEGYCALAGNDLLYSIVREYLQTDANDMINIGILKRMILWVGNNIKNIEPAKQKIDADKIFAKLTDPEVKDIISDDVRDLLKLFSRSIHI